MSSFTAIEYRGHGFQRKRALVQLHQRGSQHLAAQAVVGSRGHILGKRPFRGRRIAQRELRHALEESGLDEVRIRLEGALKRLERRLKFSLTKMQQPLLEKRGVVVLV